MKPANPPGALPDGITLEARKIQGHHELFATEGGRTWQVSDLAAVVDEENENCGQADEIGWWPTPDQQHVLVAAIRVWCFYEPEWGARSHAYLMDLRAALPQQVDLGATLWTEGDLMEPPASGVAATESALWGDLGLYAPDRRAVLTAGGAVLTSDGTITASLGKQDWALWVPARPVPQPAPATPPVEAAPAPTAN